MIKTESVFIGGEEFIYTYSDEGRYIIRDGVRYDEAYDPVGADRSYVEGDINPDNEATSEDYETALKELGVDV